MMKLGSFLTYSQDTHFPLENLPYGVFSTAQDSAPRVGTAVGDWVIDLAAFESAGLLDSAYFDQPSLNTFMAAGRTEWQRIRSRLQQVLSADVPTLRDDAILRDRALIPMRNVTMQMPVTIGDYTDFYASRQHATNVGSMFRDPDNALLPNWLHLPVAYHGRASSVVVSGTPIHRPNGQTMPPGATSPQFGASQAVDFELEMGFFIGTGNSHGQPIHIANAADHIFGLVLVNDWSARDIQRWEYVPLGPFLGKNFGTTISPWVVPLDALEPFRGSGSPQDPVPLPYLQHHGNWHYDIHLEVALQSSIMAAPHTICRSNTRYLYWNMPQQIAHHTITGCNLQTGDLLASGTISGDTADSYGSMLELAWRGERPLTLPDGTQRAYLADGDTVMMSGYAQGDGYRVGFGECRGTILPAPDLSGSVLE